MKELKKILRDGGFRLQVNMTGGGSHFIHDLTKKGGVSSIFMGANYPYDCDSQEFFFDKPDKYVSEEYAERLTSGYIYNRYGRENLTLGVTAQMTKFEEREDRFNGAYLCLYNWMNGDIFHKKVKFVSKDPNPNNTNLRELQELELSLLITVFMRNNLCIT